eukprot:scaffold10366_cov111-Skeletonema_marinoi.AAC.2
MHPILRCLLCSVSGDARRAGARRINRKERKPVGPNMMSSSVTGSHIFVNRYMELVGLRHSGLRSCNESVEPDR